MSRPLGFLLSALATSGCVLAVPAATPSGPPDNRTPMTTLPPAVAAQPTQPAPRDRWGQATVPTRNDLLAVSAPSALVAIAVGEEGTVVKTLDGGETWTVVASSPAPADRLIDVAFLDARAGWALGEKALYITQDGGESWTTQDLFGKYADYGVAEEAPGLALASYERGAVLARGHVFATTDGGASWQEIAVAKPVAGGYNDDLQGGRQLVVMGSGYGLLTPWALFRLGGGEPEKVAGLAGLTVAALAFSDASHGWALGVDGTKAAVRRTSDGGVTWTAATVATQTVGEARSALSLPTYGGKRSTLVAPGGDRAVVMGVSPGQGGRVIAETTDGTTWRIGAGLNYNVEDLAMPDADHGYAVGAGGRIWTITSK